MVPRIQMSVRRLISCHYFSVKYASVSSAYDCATAGPVPTRYGRALAAPTREGDGKPVRVGALCHLFGLDITTTRHSFLRTCTLKITELVGSTPQVSTTMPAPSYNFDAHDADLILRAALQSEPDQLKDFHVHKNILSIASTIFRDMFTLPQPPHPPAGDTTIPVIDVTESAEVLEAFLRLIYPIVPPDISSLQLVDDLFRLAEKYMADGVRARLKQILVSPSFLKDDPIWVYTLACRANLNAEAELAIPLTFNTNLVQDIPNIHLRTMTGEMHNRLLKAHADRRAELMSIVHRVVLQPQDWSGGRCACGDWLDMRLQNTINLAIWEKPFLDRGTLDLCLRKCTLSSESRCGLGSGCRLSEESISKHFTKILDEVRNLG